MGVFFYLFVDLKARRKHMEEKTNTEGRKRPFLDKPVVYGCLIGHANSFFTNIFINFRKEHKEFDEFLNDIKSIIEKEDLSYIDNILKFLSNKPQTNWISTRDSLFAAFTRIYNYDYSAQQAVKYIKQCHSIYDELLNDDYKVSNHYETSIKRALWDGVVREFIDITVSSHKNNDYFYRLTLSSLQVDGQSFDVDNMVYFSHDKTIYDDALMLFDHQQGDKLFNKVKNITLSKLVEQHIMVPKYEYTFYGHKAVGYRIDNRK